MDHGAIIVNKYGETSIPDIYAGGDIVMWPYKDRLVHIEHWENAWSQGISIAENIMEEKSSEYNEHPYFWTDQYDQTFEYLGNARKWAKTFVIPSTSGTGSEVTLVSVIADPNRNLKLEFISYSLLPDVAILDYRMTETLPPKLTASICALVE